MKTLILAPFICMVTAGVVMAGQGNVANAALSNGAPFKELDARLTALGNRLDTQEQDVTAIEDAVDSINQQISEINARLEAQDVSALIFEIQDLGENTSTDILALFDLISDMQTQIDGLGSGTGKTPSGDLNAPPQVCLTGNDLGIRSPYVVCSADENEAWISAADSAGGQYHA